MTQQHTKTSWKGYLFELISVFLGVSLAFALSTWNEQRHLRDSEQKTLIEIRNSLALDLQDIEDNIMGHKKGMESCNAFIHLAQNDEQSIDSIGMRYFYVFRDFIAVQNTSAYESLKSKGMEIIKNDSLRLQIISLYDYHFQIVEKLEETYAENQFHQSYFHPINDLLAPYLLFNKQGMPSSIQLPIRLTKEEQKRLLSYLWRMQVNRRFMLNQYKVMKEKVIALQNAITQELSHKSS